MPSSRCKDHPGTVLHLPTEPGLFVPHGSKGTCPVPQLCGQLWQEPNATWSLAEARQHAHPSHLVLLPELAQDVAVDGVLHKADIKALDAEVEVPKPEDEAVGRREGDGLEGLRLPEQGITAGGKHPQPVGSLRACSTGALRSTSVGQHSADKPGYVPALPRLLR